MSNVRSLKVSMANKNIKQIIKPTYHFIAIGLLTFMFVVLNKVGILNENTEVPTIIEQLLYFVISYRSLYIIPFVLLLLAALFIKFKHSFSWRSKYRKLFFIVLAFITGKFYTLGAFFFALGFASKHISYVGSVSSPFGYGLLSVFLGWCIWWQARTLFIGYGKLTHHSSGTPNGAP